VPRAMSLRRASPFAVALAVWASAPAFACSPGAVTQKQLDASDIVATGVIHVIEQNEQKSDGQTVIAGTAELRIGRTLRNRTPLAAPFVFHFELIRVDGCVFGMQPTDGATVKIYLQRTAPRSTELAVVHVESLER
jgi:hypothetical protein